MTLEIRAETDPWDASYVGHAHKLDLVFCYPTLNSSSYSLTSSFN
jgi:hypothetical protein